MYINSTEDDSNTSRNVWR